MGLLSSLEVPADTQAAIETKQIKKNEIPLYFLKCSPTHSK